MGQYYKFVNTDKKQVCQRNWHNIKLTEHSYVGNNYCTDILSLLSKEWKGDRIIHVGDYAEPNDGTTTQKVIEKLYRENNVKTSLYDVASEFDEVTPEKVDFNIRYVYNHDKKQYIDLFHQPIEWTCIDGNTISFAKFNSFALLTGCGNGLGGGDYFPELNKKEIGTWANDRLESSVEFIDEYKKYKENDLVFTENKYVSNKWKRFHDSEKELNKLELKTLEKDFEYYSKNRDLDYKKLKIDTYGLTEKEIDTFNNFLETIKDKSLGEDQCLQS